MTLVPFQTPAGAAPGVIEVPRNHNKWPLVTPVGGGKPVAYRRASNFGSCLTDDYQLTMWRSRQTALGLACRPDLLMAIAAHKDDKKALNDLCEQAMTAVGADAGKIMGTALHQLSEVVDRGEELSRHVPVAAAERLRLYRETLGKWLEPVAAEVFVVCDELQSGGTFDRLYRTPSGAVLVGDLKTGNIVDDKGRLYRSAEIEISVQMAIYANGQRYDPANGQRTPLHPDLDSARGVVVHLPALEGPCRLINVDLTLGMTLARMAAAVYEARRTIGLSETKLTEERLMGIVHASGGDVGPRFNELLDRLLIVIPNREQLNVTSPNGEPFDATICDVCVCDGVMAGTRHTDMWVTQKVVRDQLASHVGTGNAILGKLTKPSGKRYYKLEPPTDEDTKTAERVFPDLADQPSVPKETPPQSNGGGEEPPF